MKKLSAIAALFLFLTVAPLYAMEPFYQGEWGMNPNEIAELHDIAPTRNLSNARAAQMEYAYTIEGYPAKTVYYFDRDTGLYQINVTFFPKLTAVADVDALLNKLADTIKSTDEADAFTHEDGQFSYPADGVWNGFHNWQNTTDYISLMATITYAETDQAQTKFELDATDPKNPINGVYTQEELDNMP